MMTTNESMECINRNENRKNANRRLKKTLKSFSDFTVLVCPAFFHLQINNHRTIEGKND
jgi:hypothetical protein